MPKVLEWFPGLGIARDSYSISNGTDSAVKIKGTPTHEYPATPGIYWFHREQALRAEIVEVRRRARRLMVRVDHRYQSITKFKGLWRGPILLAPPDHQ